VAAFDETRPVGAVSQRSGYGRTRSAMALPATGSFRPIAGARASGLS